MSGLYGEKGVHVGRGVGGENLTLLLTYYYIFATTPITMGTSGMSVSAGRAPANACDDCAGTRILGSSAIICSALSASGGIRFCGCATRGTKCFAMGLTRADKGKG